jgi:hypothetical protein
MRLPIRPALFCLFSLFAFISLGLLACGGGDANSGGSGTMRISITDAPACGYDAVNITVQKVRVHQSADASDTDAGWSEVVLAPARRIELLSLSNGVLEELGQTALPAGKYTQMRLVLADNAAGNALANAVTPTGGQETALDTPSGQQSGIKMNVDLDVAADKIADFVIDFDACKSVVRRGSSGQFNLKPVLAVTPVLSDAGMRIVGYVDPAIAASAHVSAQQSGVPVKASAPDASGKFVLYPVPAGDYDLVVTAAGHVSAVMTGVPVTTSAFTTINSASLPIALPAATMRDVNGSLTPASADVRALQLLSGGPTVEIAFGSPDAATGAYAFALPIEAPLKMAYVTNPAALAFVPDAAAAGKYRLQASDGTTTKNTDIDVKAAVPPVNFALP